jgi:hypothetical protein
LTIIAEVNRNFNRGATSIQAASCDGWRGTYRLIPTPPAFADSKNKKGLIELFGSLKRLTRCCRLAAATDPVYIIIIHEAANDDFTRGNYVLVDYVHETVVYMRGVCVGCVCVGVVIGGVISVGEYVGCT